MGRADEARLRDLAEGVAIAAGFDLEDLTIVAAGRRRLVRIMIDSDHGVPLDAAAEVSRNLADLLDEQEVDPMGPAPYTLEVTSPGIGRPLTLPRHFRRSRGRLVDLTLEDGSTTIGRIRRIVGEDLELLVGKNSVLLPLSRITRAKVEVEFNGIPKADAAILAADAEGAVGVRDAVNLPGHDPEHGDTQPTDLDGADDDDLEDDDLEDDDLEVDDDDEDDPAGDDLAGDDPEDDDDAATADDDEADEEDEVR